MRSKIKKRIIAVIMVLIILTTIVYVFYGKNWLAEQQYLQRQRNSEFLKNDLMQKMLDIEEQSQEVLNEILNISYELELFQKQEIELEKISEREFKNNLIRSPYFDYKSIYLISSSQLHVLSKDLEQIKWQKEFDEELIDLELLDANRILVLTGQKNALCLNRDTGEMIWEKKLNSLPIRGNNSVFQISINKYKQLDRSIILIFYGNEIELVENITGYSLVKYQEEDEIDFLSDFDILEKSIYVIKANKISKLLFEVKS